MARFSVSDTGSVESHDALRCTGHDLADELGRRVELGVGDLKQELVVHLVADAHVQGGLSERA